MRGEADIAISVIGCWLSNNGDPRHGLNTTLAPTPPKLWWKLNVTPAAEAMFWTSPPIACKGQNQWEVTGHRSLTGDKHLQGVESLQSTWCGGFCTGAWSTYEIHHWKRWWMFIFLYWGRKPVRPEPAVLFCLLPALLSQLGYVSISCFCFSSPHLFPSSCCSSFTLPLLDFFFLVVVAVFQKSVHQRMWSLLSPGCFTHVHLLPDAVSFAQTSALRQNLKHLYLCHLFAISACLPVCGSWCVRGWLADSSFYGIYPPTATEVIISMCLWVCVWGWMCVTHGRLQRNRRSCYEAGLFVSHNCRIWDDAAFWPLSPCSVLCFPDSQIHRDNWDVEANSVLCGRQRCCPLVLLY